jgi:hypothetical protein
VKATLEQIEIAAKEIKLPMAEIQALLERLSDKYAPAETEKAPAIKKQFVLLVSDPQGFLHGHDFAGWVLQIPEEESPVTVTDRIHRASYDFNASKRGRLLPVQTIGEACESVPSKFLKEQGAWVKTRTPVSVVVTDNEIPRVEKLVSGANP